jgi:1,4-alpha-glucan branching enzyme
VGSRTASDPALAHALRPGPLDIHLLREGTHTRLHAFLGAHPLGIEQGASFAVWAPSARRVAVKGDFNDWESPGLPLAPGPDGSGLWQACVGDARVGHRYRFSIQGPDGRWHDRGDPFARAWEPLPGTAPRIVRSAHVWRDAAWIAERSQRQLPSAPISIYELHAGSWRQDRQGRALSWTELAPLVARHAGQLGFTHVELLPITEHPFAGSWGYQCTGYFAPTARHGSLDEFMAFVDCLHQHGIGVILDWVPGHFPEDAHGLALYDGTHLYDHEDPRQGHHPDWHTRLFNYDRHEVRAFLLSSAHFWLEVCHVDGLRVDAVASMLYLDYSRKPGEWIPNRHGGRENLGAIRFLRELTRSIRRAHPGVLTFAEESTAWPGVTHPVEEGGLGFDCKWNLGWMHDTLRHLARDPVHRSHHHAELTFSIWYAWRERFLLALSHDEVVHGKGSLLSRMPGTDWQRFATLRLLYGLQWAHPGMKLLFMGAEFAQRGEWSHERELDWPLTGQAPHAGVLRWVSDLNGLYRSDAALHAEDARQQGFEWVVVDDAATGVLAFLRRGRGRTVLFVCNLTPVMRHPYRLSVPIAGEWEECLNSDASAYGGDNHGNLGGVRTEDCGEGGQATLTLCIPPLAALFLRPAQPAGRTLSGP